MRSLDLLLCATLTCLSATASADLAIETETARMLKPGGSELSVAGEYQSAEEGTEFAVPLFYEYGLTPTLELLVEPTLFVGIYPDGERRTQGLGDLEITGTWLLADEQEGRPATAIALEWKAPTARNRAIGTRESDFALYLIGSKHIGDLELHGHVAYTYIGKPTQQPMQPKTDVQNTWSVSLAGEYPLATGWGVFAEATYTSAASESAEGDGASSNAQAETRGSAETGSSSEIGGAESIGILGVRYRFAPAASMFGSLSYDDSSAALLRLGMTFKF